MGTPIEIRPTNGGRLITNASADSVGLNQYREKMDFRREQDREIRGEGYDVFLPAQLLYSQQWLPVAGDTSRKVLLAELVAPNGQRAFIVGSKTTLWRFSANEISRVYAIDVFRESDTVYETISGTWHEIGSGFSASGKRWQRLAINGYLILNNGVDLPLTYQVTDTEVKPIYELRELGVGSVGFIAEHNGMLCCCDIRSFLPEDLEAWMQPSDLGVCYQTGAYSPLVLASASGTTITFSGPVSLAPVDNYIVFNDGRTRNIVSITDHTHVIVDAPIVLSGAVHFWLFVRDYDGVNQEWLIRGTNDFPDNVIGQTIQWVSGESRLITGTTPFADIVRTNSWMPVAAGLAHLTKPDAYAAYTGRTERFSWRVMWSKVNEPRRFGAVYTGSIVANSVRLDLDSRAKSIFPGMELTITGAGYGGGNHTAIAVWIQDDLYVWLSDSAKTTITNAVIQATDISYSLVGYKDLKEDSTPIVAVASLRDYLVVYKENMIFLGKWSGNPTEPLPFIRVHRGYSVPKYEHTLIEVTESERDFHLYAGNGEFYYFDLVNQKPAVFQPLAAVSSDFFPKLTTTEPWAAINAITREVWIGGAPYLLRYCYEQPSISMSSMAITAAATIARPGLTSQQWCVMAHTDGTLVRYGRVDGPKPVTYGRVTAEQPYLLHCPLGIFADEHYGWTVVIQETAPVARTAFYAIARVIDSAYVQVIPALPTGMMGTIIDLLPSIWHRRGEAYESALASGLLRGGDTQHPEVLLEGYVLIAASTSYNTPAHVEFIGARNSRELATLIESDIASPQTANLRTLELKQHLIGDRITVNAAHQPFELAGRIFEVSGIKSDSIARQLGYA